jgi:AraC-like DNA-binding protein
VSYRELRVDGQLGRWVECAWERVGPQRPDGYERIVPDGCMDLIWSEGAGVIVVGPNTTAFMAPLTPGSEVVGVRLHPGAGPPLLGVAAPALRDGRMTAAEVWGDGGERLEEAAAETGDRVGLLVQFLAARARLERASGADVAERLAVSERHLRRLVGSEVGYGPKRLGRVLRLRRALGRLRAGAELAEVAHGSGYADQAHFTNECSALAGVPPGRFLQDIAA